MRRIGITQRVEFIDAYGERRDCLDQRWAPLLEAEQLIMVPLPNSIENVDRYLQHLALDGLILSGGNDLASIQQASKVAPERDRFERLALDFACANSVPVLAVCRGMQMMGHYHGAALTALKGHVGTRHAVNTVEDFLDGSSVEVNSFHNFGFQAADLPGHLVVLGHAPDGTVEAFKHERLPHYGIMWHPEREKQIEPRDVVLLRHLFRYAPKT